MHFCVILILSAHVLLSLEKWTDITLYPVNEDCKAMSLRRRCIVGFLLSFFIELSLKVVKLYMTDGIFTLKINISRGEIIIPLG